MDGLNSVTITADRHTLTLASPSKIFTVEALCNSPL